MEKLALLAEAVLKAWALDMQKKPELAEWATTPQFDFWLKAMKEGKNQSSSR